MKVLHTWSGGIDSTSVLYQLLNQSHEVITCHVDLVQKNFNNCRWQAEQKSIEQITKWFNDRGQKFKHIDGGKTELTGRWDDVAVIGLHTGNILRANPSIEATTENMSTNDWSTRAARERIRNRIAIAEMVARRKPIWIQLNEFKTREQVIKEMPADLVSLTTFCRSPRQDGESFSTCGQCHTCRETIQFVN